MTTYIIFKDTKKNPVIVSGTPEHTATYPRGLNPFVWDHGDAAHIVGEEDADPPANKLTCDLPRDGTMVTGADLGRPEIGHIYFAPGRPEARG